MNEIHDNQAVSISFQSPNNTVLCPQGMCQWYFDEGIGRINNLPAGYYFASASLLTGFVSNGMMLTPFWVTEDMDGQELHVYVPNFLPFKEIQDRGEQIELGETLSNLLDMCGLGPITTENIEWDQTCIKSEGELT